MAHLKRLLWLFAWSLWLLLGLGLYRELPRELGPAVCQLPLGKDDVMSFAGPSLVAIQKLPVPTPTSIRLVDAETGEVVRILPTEDHQPVFQWGPRRFGVGFWGFWGSGGRPQDFKAYHAREGRWTTISKRAPTRVAFHPTRPWIAIQERQNLPNDGSRPLVVVDYLTGAELFVRPRGTGSPIAAPPFFLGETDRLAVPISDLGIEYDVIKPTDLEVWRVGAPCERERIIHLPSFGRDVQVSADGRRLAAFIYGRGGSYTDVFDLDDGRVAFSSPPTEYDQFMRPQSGMRFSRNGRAVLDGQPQRLWDVETGRVLWSPRPWESVFFIERDDNSFVAVESWDAPWTRGRLRSWSTLAVRDLDTGAVRFRCWHKEYSALRTCSPDGALCVVPSGLVHRLPLQVNYPLLTLCQTILALPLILLWLTLRYHRRRAAQRKLAVATP